MKYVQKLYCSRNGFRATGPKTMSVERLRDFYRNVQRYIAREDALKAEKAARGLFFCEINVVNKVFYYNEKKRSTIQEKIAEFVIVDGFRTLAGLQSKYIANACNISTITCR